MILTCDKCHTRYLLPASSLGDGGRRVRCTICRHEWFEEPGTESFSDILDQADTPQDSVNRPVHEDEFVLLAEDVIPPPETEKKPFVWGVGMTTGLVAAIFIAVAVFTCLLMFRAPVLKIWPDGLALYNALDLTDPAPGEGLAFENLQATTSYNAQGVEILRVTGDIKNVTDYAVEVPGLRFSLRRADGTESESWSYPSPKADIPARQSIPLTATYPQIAKDVKDLNVRFVNE